MNVFNLSCLLINHHLTRIEIEIESEVTGKKRGGKRNMLLRLIH